MGVKLRVSPLYVKVEIRAEFYLLNSLVLYYGREAKKYSNKVLDGGQIFLSISNSSNERPKKWDAVVKSSKLILLELV
jgi:hypothetical protein